MAEVGRKKVKDYKIYFDHVSKTFKTRKQDIVAVKDFSIGVSEGEFVSIIGPSGCGKSTIIRMLDRLIDPSEGSIYIDGEDVSKGKMPNTIRQKMGFIFQEPNLLPWLSIKQNVEFPLTIFKIDKNDPKVQERVDDLLKMTGLENASDSYPADVSGGMMQRVGVIRAMVHNPEILLMDEPFGALDGLTQNSLDMWLHNLWAKSKKTIIFITHSVEEAVLLSNRVFVMATQPGRLVSVENIGLPFPRNLDMVRSEQFLAYTKKLTQMIGKLDLRNIK